MQTVDQQLLAWANQSVMLVVGQSAARRAKYSTAVRGAPAFVQGCGLAQAVAFWQSKKGEDKIAYEALLEHLASAPGLGDLRTRAAECDVTTYVFLTTRVQAALVFLKRMVDAYLPDEPSGADA